MVFITTQTTPTPYNKADNQGDAPTAFAGEVNYGLPIADRFHIQRILAMSKARAAIACF